MPAAADPLAVNGDRRAAGLAGALFLAAFLAYGGGSAIVASFTEAPQVLAMIAGGEHLFAAGAALMLANSAIVLGIGVVLAPILARRSPTVASLYLGTRIFEAVLLAFGVVWLLTLVPLAGGPTGGEIAAALTAQAIKANFHAFQIAMLALGLGSLPFCALLLRASLVPPLLAIWGLAGYLIFAAGALAELFGLGYGLALSIPGGLFELAFGLWLIFRGIRAQA